MTLLDSLNLRDCCCCCKRGTSSYRARNAESRGFLIVPPRLILRPDREYWPEVLWPRVPLLLNLHNKARSVLRRSRVECKFAKRAYARKYHLSRRFCEKLCAGNPRTDASISSRRTGISVATAWQMLMFACRIIQSAASHISAAAFRQSHCKSFSGLQGLRKLQ